jgi:2-polyprenyl-3-methyl-5-hydroxy-6-metoxy-1,4-benzoquinol methylase
MTTASPTDMRSSRDPKLEIAAGNPWYIDDQVAVQFGSPAFRAVVENRWRVFTRAIDEWVAMNAGHTPARILDAGCGDGINLSFLGRLVDARGWRTRLAAADYSALRIGRARNQRQSALIQSSLTSLGFRESTFDVILCNQVLEHVPDCPAALRELRRVLRPGGLLLIGVPNEGSALGRLRNRVLQRSISRSTDHVNMFTRQLLLRWLQDADMDVTRIEPESFFVPHTVIHGWLNRWRPVRHLLSAAGRRFPRCAAGLLAAARRGR